MIAQRGFRKNGRRNIFTPQNSSFTLNSDAAMLHIDEIGLQGSAEALSSISFKKPDFLNLQLHQEIRGVRNEE